MPFYLQDSGSAYWQLGVTVDGREQNVGVGAQSIVALVVKDTSGVYWQAGISTSGRLQWTVTSPATTTLIILTAANGSNWTLGVTTDGRTQLSTPIAFEPCEDGYIPPLLAGWDSLVTVW